MTVSKDPLTYQLNVQAQCDVSLQALEGLGNLLGELLPLAQIPHLEHLAAVLVIQEGHMGATLSELAKSDRNYGPTSAPLPTAATGTAIAIETDDGLRCYVILERHRIRELTSENYRQWDATSTVLEELLHVRHFSGMADHLFSPISQLRQSGLERNETLLMICLSALGEYMANRWKAQMVSTLPLYPVEGGYTSVSLGYPDALGPLLDLAGDTIINIVTGTAAHAVPLDDGWRRMILATYRGILEPLARDYGYRDGNSKGMKTPIQKPAATSSWFYSRHVVPYWRSWCRQLRRAFDTFETDQEGHLSVVVSMRTTLLRFLRHVGVEYNQVGDAQIYAWFDGSIALALK